MPFSCVGDKKPSKGLGRCLQNWGFVRFRNYSRVKKRSTAYSTPSLEYAKTKLHWLYADDKSRKSYYLFCLKLNHVSFGGGGRLMAFFDEI